MNMFAFMAELLREWLTSARTSEITDALELFSQELLRPSGTRRRGSS